MGGSLAVNRKVFKKIMFFYKLSVTECLPAKISNYKGFKNIRHEAEKHYENTKTVINFLRAKKK